MNRIVLASASPRRKALLEQAGIPHVVIPGDFDEESVKPDGPPEEYVVKLARIKAERVAKDLESGLIIGADTIVVLDGLVFGKPGDGAEAFEMLKKLSGKTHSVITGIALISKSANAGGISLRTDYEITRVKFANLTDDEINSYISTGEPFGKAGAYAIQGRGELFAEEIYGSYSNVVGLPLFKLCRLLEDFNIRPSDFWSKG